MTVPKCGKVILSTGSRVVRSKIGRFCREDSKTVGCEHSEGMCGKYKGCSYPKDR